MATAKRKRSVQPAGKSILPVIRELARTYQAFSAYDAAGFTDVDLTVPQADVLFTLGNTQGLTCKEIGEKSCITKGTLTGVIDRLAARGLLERWEDLYDGRKTVIALTGKGEALFAKAYPIYLDRLSNRLRELDIKTIRQSISSLKEIRTLFS